MKLFILTLLFISGLATVPSVLAYTPPALPIINTNNVVTVTSPPYNAVGDGVTTNTTAIQAAIAKAAAGGTTNGAAGGTVEIPPGIYLSGPLTLASAVNLQIDAGAILRMLPLGQYPGGTNTGTTFISGSNLHDIEISGSGAIDGQGAAWWPYSTVTGALRPRMFSPSDCNRLLIQNVTLSNSPMFHIAISGSKSGNSTVQGVTIYAPGSSPNTDACDVDGTNILVQNCNISEGDDDFTCGGGTSGVLLTNNTYGTGHGISIGSYTDSGGVSNITVINCTMNGTVNGIRIKSDAGRGGLVQNITYANIGMTNVNFPIQIYSYYLEVGTPGGISPNYAATQTVAAVTGTTPIYRIITFSNITATSLSGYPIGILWARTEMPMTNIIFNKVHITGNRSFNLYNVHGAQFIDCNLKCTATTNTFQLFNSQAVITNSAPTNTLFTFDGLTTNGYGNQLSFYNASGSLKNTNVFDDGPLTLSSSTLTISNNLTLFPATVLNYSLGTNAATVSVSSNFTLGGTINVMAGAGFSNGVYTLLTCGKILSGNLPALGTTPPNYNYSLYFGAAAPNVVLSVILLPPANLVATATNLQINLKWNAVNGATSYNLKRGTVSGSYSTVFSGLTTTNFTDVTVTNTVNYYYVVTAFGAGGESTNSSEVSATPLPSNQPANIVALVVGDQLQLSWPQDHLGWRLQIQTNSLSAGLGTNWSTVANSTNVNQLSVPIISTSDSVFLRLIYP
jgi:polygalacturonase